MARKEKRTDPIRVEGAPDIPGLAFRKFGGDADYPQMVRVLRQSRMADKIDLTTSCDQMRRFFEHLLNCNPHNEFFSQLVCLL